MVSDETLPETLQAYRDPRECADRMIELALRGGGPDNITCIVADVVDIDFGEDAPIMGGSVGDGSDDAPPPDSAAARASATTLTRVAPQRVVPPVAAPAASSQRSRMRVALLALVALVVLVVGAVLARAWVMQQYFVGADGDQVVIFQGVQGSVLGKTQAAAAVDVGRLPRDAARHPAQVVLLGGEEAEGRPAEVQPVAERLALADAEVDVELAGGRSTPSVSGSACDDQQRVALGAPTAPRGPRSRRRSSAGRRRSRRRRRRRRRSW